MLVTIATPTYNRAKLLPRLYRSLCAQTCADFEWIIVDDGSTDDTSQIIQSFINEGRIPQIRYVHKSNGGKHTAINTAAKVARGELFFIADSDDWLPINSIADVIDVYVTIQDDQHFCGVCGLDQYADGTIVGRGLQLATIDATPSDIRLKWGVVGDLKEVFLTSVIRDYLFPEIPGERFCPEVLVWNRIGKKYMLRYFNKPIYTVEYQPDGITSGIIRARMNSPIASMMTYSEWLDQSKSIKAKFRMAINYWRFAFCTSKRKIPIKSWAYLFAPIGLLMHLKDKRTIKI